MRKKYIILFAIIFSCSAACYTYSLKDRLIKILKNKIGCKNISDKQGFEQRYDNYSTKDKEFIKLHVDNALKNLKYKTSNKIEKTAALNSYIYQYLISKNNSGGAVKILTDGHAICGGHAVVLAEMLYSIGIKSKFAFLIGIPDQGAHSLLEVIIDENNQGLFDPTFGIFWLDSITTRPVSIYKLLKNPDICNQTLLKSKYEKRKSTEDSIRPIKGIKYDYYKAKPNYSESNYYPYLCFKSNRGGGTANSGITTFVQVEIEPNTFIGDTIINPNKKLWQNLALYKNKKGEYVSWLYTLGKSFNGYDINHIYKLKNLDPNMKYYLKIFVFNNYKKDRLSVQLLDTIHPTRYYSIPEISENSANHKPILIEFIPKKENFEIILDYNSYMIINALELCESNG